MLPHTLVYYILSLTTVAYAHPPPASYHPDTRHRADVQNSIPGSHADPHSSSLQPPRQIRTPTRYESTLLARRLLALSSTGYLSTSFPSAQNLSADPAYRWTPSEVAGAAIGLPEYFAACNGGSESEEDGGDPVMIRLRISTTGKNSRNGGNVSLGVDWWSQEHLRERRGSQSFDAMGWIDRSPSSLPRMALLGYLEVLDDEEVEKQKVVQCFERRHADAKHWRPGSERGAHTGEWVRLRVKAVYWVGGFGGRAWIGWLDVEGEWDRVKREGWENVRLPGEEGWEKMPWFEGGQEAWMETVGVEASMGQDVDMMRYES
ncbi:uncharacterized protein AB675_9232 [Cyphellophora attinorum]|uniref:CREG-like beta-barrel domain-containing protein n=1 Tax=Cyphellophora attinorum TaxID=1664694 RepID=A0A0N0NNG9_9EURO|nr:uncharacterized protein AB675_9232 [Phialophora attinorum]KPI41601.1 hypothetical protein AB675_9232 [Phialophora attinorum]